MSSDLIDPDICKAHTLPSRFYTDELVFADIISGFRECWHFAAHESQLMEYNVPVSYTHLTLPTIYSV